MKITFSQLILLMLLTSMSYSKPSKAQEVLNKKINITAADKTLADVLKLLAKTNGVQFIYNHDVIKTSDKISVDFNNLELKQVLDKLLTKYAINYQVFKNKIILIDGENTDTKAKSSQTTRAVLATPITGKVVDEKNETIIGVSITIKGTTRGTITDINGEFKLQVDKGDILVFKSIGYVSQEVPVNLNEPMNIQMIAEQKSLNEVVVIGYGTKKKADLTGTVASIGGEDIVSSKATNATEAMQGRLSGVDIKRSSGKPGSDFFIEIRGQNSFGNTQPLYVVDGVPFGVGTNVNNPINDINPADIERIDVLKDASSTAIYGSRGANGVVIVTTKKGVKGAPRVTYDGHVGIVNAYNLPPTMDGPTFVNYARDYFNEQAQAAALLSNPPQPLPTTPVADSKVFSATELSNIANGTYTNWINLIKQNGINTNHNIGITGGDDKTSYFASMGFQDYQGTVKTEDERKYTLKVGLDVNLNKTFKFGASLYSVYNDISTGSGEAFRSAYRLRPTGSAYNADGSPRFFTYEGESQITNPLSDFTGEIRSQQYLRAFPNVYGQITFIKGLTFKSSFSPDITFQRTGLYDDQFTKQNAGTKPASASNGKNNYFNYTFTNLLSYITTKGKSQFDITLGSEIDYYQQDNNNITVTGLPYKSLWFNVSSVVPITINGNTIQPTTAVSSGYSQYNLQSYLARANYTFNNRYLFTVSIRADGNSKFAEGHKWGYFPSGAFAWRISEEDFMKKATFIDNLKLRLSFGKAGNDANSGPYGTQQGVVGSLYNFGSSNANGFGIGTVLANKNLSWEKTTEYDAGIDMDVLKNRISLEANYYRKTVNGAIQNVLIPPTNGFLSTVINIGCIRNSGIELGLNTTNIRKKDFTWTTNINYTHNHNELLELDGSGLNNVGNQKFIGQKINVVYGYKIIGVWQQSEAAQAAVYGQIPGQYKIQDITTSGLSTALPTAANLSSDGKINANDNQILGSSIPNWFGGITNTVKYKNLDFTVVVYTRQGTFEQSTFLNQVMDGDQTRARFNAFDRSYWTPDNPSNTWANEAREQDGGRRGISEFSNSSYTKISNITLGYTLPKTILDKIKIRKLRVYVDAFNPFIFTKFVGWDPEEASANSFSNAEFRTRTFILGVNVSL